MGIEKETCETCPDFSCGYMEEHGTCSVYDKLASRGDPICGTRENQILESEEDE